MLLFLHGFSSNFVTTTILHLQESTVNVVMIIISLFAKIKLQDFITLNGILAQHISVRVYDVIHVCYNVHSSI